MKKILTVPYIDQSVRYPTGCESVSAVMMLRYLGYDISVDTFIDEFLDKRAMEVRDGQLYGPDPREYFCGSPYDEDSFGCYIPVMIRALTKAAGDRFSFVDETGTPVSDLLKKYIDQDMPVLFWACINMEKEIIGPQWKLFDTKETFTWRSNEHCMVLVGYDEDGYYFNDPYDNHGLIRYDKALTEARHEAQYGMACGISHCLCNEKYHSQK